MKYTKNRILFSIVLIIVIFISAFSLSFLFKKDNFENNNEISDDTMKMKQYSNNVSYEENMLHAQKLSGDYFNNVIFHCYWDGDLNEKTVISIKSCYYFNTINRRDRSIILWVHNCSDNSFKQEASKYAEIREFDLIEQQKDTFMENMECNIKNYNPSFFSDVVRYTLLYKYGGCWFDLDVFFLRSLDPIFINFENEIIVYNWDNQPHPNGAIFISLIPQSDKMKNNIKFLINNNGGWGFQEAALNYDSPMDLLVLPCNWFDPAWVDNPYNFHFDDFFKKSENTYTFDDFFKGSFTYHWHNRWNNEIEVDSPCYQINMIIDKNI
jgi:mannosyltransferase OCH1-like enzyme